MDLSRQQGAELAGDLRLGVIPTIAPYLLPLFIESVSKQFPKVQLTVDELKTETIIGMLKDDHLDAGILATPLNEPGLREKPSTTNPFICTSPKDTLSIRANASKRTTFKDMICGCLPMATAFATDRSLLFSREWRRRFSKCAIRGRQYRYFAQHHS